MEPKSQLSSTTKWKIERTTGGIYRVMYRVCPEMPFMFMCSRSFLWEARRYVKKQIKKDNRVVKTYDKYVEYWP